MSTRIFILPQSQTDLVTNSSSEIFLTNGVSLDAINDMIKDLDIDSNIFDISICNGFDNNNVEALLTTVDEPEMLIYLILGYNIRFKDNVSKVISDSHWDVKHNIVTAIIGILTYEDRVKLSNVITISFEDHNDDGFTLQRALTNSIIYRDRH